MDGLGEIRRIITGHDDTGRAVVLQDDDTPYKRVRAGRGSVSRLFWTTHEAPAAHHSDDPAADFTGTAPPSRGSVLRIVDFPPFTEEEIAAFDPAYLANIHGGHEASNRRPPSHPFMHRTSSIDYAIVLAGEIDMKLDEAWLHFKAGDVLVQQATNHAWVNRSGAYCRIAFVLIDAT